MPSQIIETPVHTTRGPRGAPAPANVPTIQFPEHELHSPRWRTQTETSPPVWSSPPYGQCVRINHQSFLQNDFMREPSPPFLPHTLSPSRVNPRELVESWSSTPFSRSFSASINFFFSPLSLSLWSHNACCVHPQHTLVFKFIYNNVMK